MTNGSRCRCFWIREPPESTGQATRRARAGLAVSVPGCKLIWVVCRPDSTNRVECCGHKRYERRSCDAPLHARRRVSRQDGRRQSRHGKALYLLVEDETTLREHLARAFSDEYVVDTAADGREALQAVLRAPPCLV
jgi:hypothetical protein